MNSNCIVTQVHIPDYDVQGQLSKNEKLKLVNFGLTHLRKFNPNAYIILTGHGHRPDGLDNCDYVYWEDICRPLDDGGYVAGMPAQFMFISLGIEHAVEKGFTRILKTRGDCVIGIKNICDHCDAILESEKRPLLITQQTGDGLLGDCFMYGDVHILNRTWCRTNKIHSDNGLVNTAKNFMAAVASDGDWATTVRSTCAFRNVDKLKFTCLRWNFRQLGDLNDLLKPNFEFEKYHWGRAGDWHIFHADGSMTGIANWAWSEKEFYDK